MIQTENKILTVSQLQEKIKQLRTENKRIVFTNGCFDIVHLGHTDYLEKARNLGDFLVVGLNSDASVQGLKGPTRPLVGQYARSRVMAAFAFVDAVVLFYEPTPIHLIEALLPDILVKGDDYSVENIVGASAVLANGGQVATVPLVAGYSTTALVEKIRKN